MYLDHIIGDVLAEFVSAEAAYGPMASAHEGYAILLEEVEELWDEVKKKPTARDKAHMRAEAIQIAAMAMRFVKDVCE